MVRRDDDKFREGKRKALQKLKPKQKLRSWESKRGPEEKALYGGSKGCQIETSSRAVQVGTSQLNCG